MYDKPLSSLITYLKSQVTQHLSDSWWAVIGSVSLALIMAYIFKNQESEFTTQKRVTSLAKKELTNYRFLYSKAEGDDKTVCHYIFYIISNLLLNV